MGKIADSKRGDASASGCRSRPRREAALPREEGALRPTDVIGAFFVAALVFILAGVFVTLLGSAAGWTWTRWLALHLIFVGGISQLILGASQFFAGAFLATGPPPRALVRAQLAAWNSGALMLAVSVPAGLHGLAGLATAILLGGLVLYLLGLTGLRKRSLQRVPFATRWYSAGAVFLAVGFLAGASIAVGATWPHGDLLGAHMALNLAGWFGVAIVGTLHTFYPSLARTQLAHPRLERWTFGLWTGGVATLAAGYGLAVDLLAIAGWLGLGAAASLLGVNVARCAAAAPRPLSLPARLLAVAQVLLVAGLAVAIASALVEGPGAVLSGSTRAAIAMLFVPGWIGLTVLGSLLHLLAVVVRVRDFSRALPAPSPPADSALAAIAAIAIGAMALSQSSALGDLFLPATIGFLVVYGILATRILRLAGALVTVARPSV